MYYFQYPPPFWSSNFTHVLQSAHRYAKLQPSVQNTSKSAHYHPLDPLPLFFDQNAHYSVLVTTSNPDFEIVPADAALSTINK